MGCDMMVALGPATVHGQTLFGVNHFNLTPQRLQLCSFANQTHPVDAFVPLAAVELPQVRHTHGILGMQPAHTWGLTHGVSDVHVAVGMARWQSRRRLASVPSNIFPARPVDSSDWQISAPSFGPATARRVVFFDCLGAG